MNNSYDQNTNKKRNTKFVNFCKTFLKQELMKPQFQISKYEKKLKYI